MIFRFRTFMQTNSTRLDILEAESFHILRSAVEQGKRPVMLYSTGKDSTVMLHLAYKAFYPNPIPFPILHIDSTFKFKEMVEFRDRMAKRYNVECLVHVNEKGRAAGVTPWDNGSREYTDIMKTQALLQALKKGNYDIVFGGARREEEKSRAKEHVFSFRDKGQHWDPKNQRIEMWDIFNGNVHFRESVRVFPLSNWTELDVWKYIKREHIPVVDLYFAKSRLCINRDGMLIVRDDDRMPLEPGEQEQLRTIRFRTLGCYPLTGAIESEAHTLNDIIDELEHSHYSERHTRLIDFDSAFSMEEKKKNGYF